MERNQNMPSTSDFVINTAVKQTPKEAGFKFVQHWGHKQYIFKNIHTGANELFVCNKNHAGWGLKYNNTHLEFCAALA